MRCRSARKLLYQFLDGLEDDGKRLALEQHLGRCSTCETLAAQLARSLDLLHRAPQEKPSENFSWKLRLRLNEERLSTEAQAVSQRAWLRSWNVRYAASAVAAFAVILAAGWISYRAGFGPLGVERTSGGMDRRSADVAAGANANIPASKPVTRSSDALKPVRPSTGAGWSQSVGLVSEGTPGRDNAQGLPRVLDDGSIPSNRGLDSMVTHALEAMTTEQKIWYLRGNIQFLENHLRRYQTTEPDSSNR
jgi:hypothetical protein